MISGSLFFYQNWLSFLLTKAAKRDALVSKKKAMESKLKFFLHYAETLRGHDAITEFSEDLWLKAIDHVTICKDGGMVFLFKDGSEITVYNELGVRNAPFIFMQRNAEKLQRNGERPTTR